jgi:hypothetical protein
VYDPVGKTPGAVDTGVPVGDDGAYLNNRPLDRWTPVDEWWTTIGPVASANGPSSTIHNPYYCHCQNSIL